MCQKLVKEKLTLNTNQAQLCASPPTHPFIGGKSCSVSLPMLLQRQPTPSSQMTKMKVWEAENRKKKKIQLTFCSAARIPAGHRVLPALLRGLPRIKDLICMSAALRNKFHRAPHPVCFGPQCHCRGSLTAATIFFCYEKIHARGSIRDTKLIKSCPCLDERRSCRTKSSLCLALLAFSVLKGSPGVQPMPCNVWDRDARWGLSGVGQGHTDRFCLALWGKLVCSGQISVWIQVLIVSLCVLFPVRFIYPDFT